MLPDYRKLDAVTLALTAIEAIHHDDLAHADYYCELAAGKAQQLANALRLADEWLDNLALAIGETKLVDSLPNGSDGRIGIKRALSEAAPLTSERGR